MGNRRGHHTLQILHTNDVHSHFPEMARISTGLKVIGASALEKGYQTVNVDLGDQMDRMHIRTEATWGQSNVDVMNALGYRWVTVGNNEGLTFPREQFNALYKRAHFQVLCANLIDENTGEFPPFIKPYEIETLSDGLKVAWIGLTAPYDRFYCLLGLQPLSPLDTIKNILQEIREKVDLVVLLSHLGYNADLNLAENVEGIDVVLGAHTHTYLPEGEWVGNTMIAQTGKFGEYLGKVEIFYNDQKEILGTSATCIPTEEFAPDPEISALLEAQQNLSEQIMDVEVARLKETLPISWEKESPLGNLLARGLHAWMDADVGIVNSGALLDSLKQGSVTRKDLLHLCPHPINPCKMELTGTQLKEIFEEALCKEVIYRELRGFGFRGKVIGWLCVEGAQIHYDPEREHGERIREVWIGNRPMLEKETYTIGTIDMFTFGVIFPTFKEGNNLQFYFPEFLRDVLQTELQKEASLQACRKQSWIRC